MKYCGDCTNWRCDNPLILKGHCNISRMIAFHDSDACDSNYQSKWEYERPALPGDNE